MRARQQPSAHQRVNAVMDVDTASLATSCSQVDSPLMRRSRQHKPQVQPFEMSDLSNTAPSQAACSSEAVSASEEPLMERVLTRAWKKFDQLDQNAVGVLEGEELLGLAEWMWGSFHPGGEPLSSEQRGVEGEKLFRRVTSNGDGAMDFDEFAAWFRRTCVSIMRARQQPSAHQRVNAVMDDDTASLATSCSQVDSPNTVSEALPEETPDWSDQQRHAQEVQQQNIRQAAEHYYSSQQTLIRAEQNGVAQGYREQACTSVSQCLTSKSPLHSPSLVPIVTNGPAYIVAPPATADHANSSHERVNASADDGSSPAASSSSSEQQCISSPVTRGLSSTTPSMSAGTMEVAFGSRIFSPGEDVDIDELPFTEVEAMARKLQPEQKELIDKFLTLQQAYRPRRCKFTDTIYAEAWNTPGVRRRHGNYSHKRENERFEEEEEEASENEENVIRQAVYLCTHDMDGMMDELNRLEKRHDDDLSVTRRCVRTGAIYTEACNHAHAARYCPGKLHPQGKFWTCCGQPDKPGHIACTMGRHEDRADFRCFYGDYMNEQRRQVEVNGQPSNPSQDEIENSRESNA